MILTRKIGGQGLVPAPYAENLSVRHRLALDMIPEEYIREASPLSLSTTLARTPASKTRADGPSSVLRPADEFIRRFDARANYTDSITIRPLCRFAWLAPRDYRRRAGLGRGDIRAGRLAVRRGRPFGCGGLRHQLRRPLRAPYEELGTGRFSAAARVWPAT